MDQDLCYICFGDHTENGGFLDSACSCTGSLKIHLFCLTRLVINNQFNCMTCKKTFTPIQEQKNLVIQKYNINTVAIQQVNARFKLDGVTSLYLMTLDTQVKLKEINYSNGNKHGKTYEWHFIPKKRIYYLAKEINYNMNVLHGTSINYYPNGVCETITNYANGKKHGEYIRRYQNNVLMQTSLFKNGKRHGAFTSFYPNCNPDTICTYNNGLFDGHYIKFRRNGTVLQTHTYENGVIMTERSKDTFMTSIIPKRRYSL